MNYFRLFAGNQNYLRTMEVKGNNNDIDVLDLFANFGGLMKRLFLILVKLLLGIRRVVIDNLRVFIICGIIGGFLGGAMNYFRPTNYESHMIVRSGYLSSSLLNSPITRLNQLCERQDYVELAESLGIEKELAQNLVRVSFEPSSMKENFSDVSLFKKEFKLSEKNAKVYNDIMKQLWIERRGTFKIIIRVKDNSRLKELTQPMMEYLKSIPYIYERLRADKKHLSLKSRNIDQELSKLDSLESLLFLNLRKDHTANTTPSIILGEDKSDSPIDVLVHATNKYNDKLNIDRQMLLEENFEIYCGFEVSERIKESLLKSVIMCFITAVLLALFVVLMIRFNRYLRKVEDQLI